MIPDRINAYRLTDDQMMVLDAMRLKACHIIQGTLHQHHRSKEGKHHRRCRRGRRAFSAWDVPVMIAEIASDLPLMTVYTSKPTTVSMANAAIRSGFSSHTGLIAAGFLIQRKPGSTVVCCS